MAKRPVSILRYNATQMKRQGATDAEVDAYLADNGVTGDFILSIPMPTQEQLDKALEFEKSDKFAQLQKQAAEAEEKVARDKRNIERLKTAQGIARGFGQGLTFGTADELESALTGQDVQSIRAEQREFNLTHPVLGVGSEIAGAIANPLGTYGAAGKSASLGAKVARGATTGAVGGALYGFGSGEGGLEKRLENAVTTGAVSGALGAAMPVAVEGVKRGAQAVRQGLGFTTGAGNAIEQAYKAGASGDDELLKAMRGEGSVQDVVAEAKTAAQNIRNQAMNKYRVAMEGLPDEKINVKSIKNALNDAIEENTLNKGVVDKTADKFLREAKSQMSKLTRGTKNQVSVRDVDKIKQAIQSIEVPADARNAQRVKTSISNVIRSEIKQSAPVYSQIMRDYGEVASKLNEIDKVLSLSPGQSTDTAVRKLQSLMRDGVETNYGNRVALADYLEQVGGANIKNKIAGQSLSAWLPRGVVARGLAGATGFGAMTNPSVALGLVTASPRLVGETAYKWGQISRALDKLPRSNIPAYGLVGAAQQIK